MKYSSFLLLTLSALLLTACQLIPSRVSQFNKPSPQNISTPSSFVGADKDVHGCLLSAGYSWCPIKQKCLRPREEPCTGASDIKTALIQKDNLKEPIYVIVDKENSNFARGEVTSDPKITGKKFLAVQVNGFWQIPYSGNDQANCSALKTQYRFPKEFLLGICQ
jgi:hypothetical protein